MEKTQMRYWFVLAIVGFVIVWGFHYADNSVHGFVIENMSVQKGENLLCHVMEYENGTEYPECHVMKDSPTMPMDMDMSMGMGK
jgi:hypothetical protein